MGTFAPAFVYLTRTDEVEAAVIAFLKAKLASVPIKDIAALTLEDMDEDDNILVQAPAARITFMKEELTDSDDNTYLNYKSVQEWMALVGAERPNTVDVERGAAQDVLEHVKNALAGARISLPSNADGAQISLRAAALFQMKAEGTWYAIRFAVVTWTQFKGNSDPSQL